MATDISTTALRRAAAEADARGVANRIEFVHQDLTRGFPRGEFDLVSAQFLHSTAMQDRAPILRRAARAIACGGLLLIVDHGAAPTWATKLGHDHHFPSVEEVVSSLCLDGVAWERVRMEVVERQARGPDGEIGTLIDNVIGFRRRDPPPGGLPHRR